jgi:hypothetical protein
MNIQTGDTYKSMIILDVKYFPETEIYDFLVTFEGWETKHYNAVITQSIIQNFKRIMGPGPNLDKLIMEMIYETLIDKAMKEQ